MYFPTVGAVRVPFLVCDYFKFKDFEIMKFVWKCFDKYLSQNVLDYYIRFNIRKYTKKSQY